MTLALDARALRPMSRRCRACRSPSAVSWRIAAPYRSHGALYRDPKFPPSATIQFFFVSRPRVRPAYDTNFVSQHPHLARLRARCALCCRPPRPCRVQGRPYRGRARPCCAPFLARPGLRACCVPQYNLLYCDSIFKKWAVAHFSSSNLFFFPDPPIASLPLLKCSSLDHRNSYNSKFF